MTQQFCILYSSGMKNYNHSKTPQACVLSRVRLFATPWTVARQAPLSMGFSRQKYWSALPCPPPEDLLHPGIS